MKLTALALCVALAGCATSPPPISAPASVEQVALRAGQAVYVATLTLDAASVAATAAAPSLSPAQARAVLSALTAGREALGLAQRAYAAGDMLAAKAQADAARSQSLSVQNQVAGAHP